MSSNRTHRWFAITLASSLLLSPVPVLAEEPPTKAEQMKEARDRYERGVQLYDEGAYDAALVEFERAYQLAPNFKILYNIAQIRYQLNDHAGALRGFQQYLDQGGTEVPEGRRAEVKKMISVLKSRVASIEITTEPGADVYIDDIPVGKAPLKDPVIVNAGTRRFSASKDGKVSSTRVVTVAGGDTVKVTLDFAKGPSPAATTPGEVKPTSHIPIVPWAVTGTLLVGAGVTGFITLNAESKLTDKRNQANVTRGELDDAQSNVKRFALITDILTGAAIVAGGVSIYLTVKSGNSKESAPAPSSQVGVVFGPGSVALSGAF